MLNLPEIQQKNKVCRDGGWFGGFFKKNFADSHHQIVCWWPWKPQRNLMEEGMGEEGEERKRRGKRRRRKGTGGNKRRWETDEKAATTVCFLLLLWEGIRNRRFSLVTGKYQVLRGWSHMYAFNALLYSISKPGMGSQASLNAVDWISPLHCDKWGQQKVDMQNTVQKGTGNVSAELYLRVHQSLGTLSKGSSLLGVAWRIYEFLTTLVRKESHF